MSSSLIEQTPLDPNHQHMNAAAIDYSMQQLTSQLQANFRYHQLQQQQQLQQQSISRSDSPGPGLLKPKTNWTAKNSSSK
jgi:hypothetical protein